MGLGRFFNVHKQKPLKRKRAVAPISEQEVDSPFYNLQETSTDLASSAVAENVEAMWSARHDDWLCNGIGENDGDLEYSRDDDEGVDRDGDGHGHALLDVGDDEEEKLSCISNVYVSSEWQGAPSEWQGAQTAHNDQDGHAMPASKYLHEDDICMSLDEDEQGVSMELDAIDDDDDACDCNPPTYSSLETGFLHSSGRPTLKQEASYGSKRRTIDSEFEEYFASLLLK